MKKVLLITFSLVHGISHAQDYATFVVGDTAYYSTSHEIFYVPKLTEFGVYIDSTAVIPGGSENYNYLHFDIFPLSTDPQWRRSSWAGVSIMSFNNGMDCFINADSDTIFINTLALTGVPWNLYHFPNND